MNTHDTNILANAAQSGAISRLQNGDGVDRFNDLQTESWLALTRLCNQASQDREAAVAAAAGDELERQLDGAA